MDEKFYTPYSKEEILTAFRRALGDLTDRQIFSLIADEAALRAEEDDVLSRAIAAINADLAANYVRSTALDAETAARTAADQLHAAEIAELTDSGAKNLLAVTAATQTVAGITYTVGSGGTVSASGTATGISIITIGQLSLKEGQQLVLSGCPAGGNYNSGYSLYIAKAVAGAYTLVHDDGGGAAFTVPEDAVYNIRTVIRPAGYTVDGIVYRPMVCTQAAWGFSHQFVPYAPPACEMWAAIRVLQQLHSTAQQRATGQPPETEAEHA